MQDFHGLVVLRWVGGCSGSAALTLSYTRVRGGYFQGVWVGVVRGPAPRSVQKSSTSPASRAVIALFVKVLSSRPPRLPHSLCQPQAGGLYCEFSKKKQKNKPSEKISTDGEHLCYRTPVQLEEKDWISHLQGFSPIQLPAPSDSYLRRGPVWA